MNLKRRNKVSAEFSMSSMTDIVFLLLIFFMLTSTLVTTHALDLTLPRAKGKSTQKQIISVSITNDLKYYIDRDLIEKNHIELKLQELLSGQENPRISIRAEYKVPFENVVEVMDIASRNKYKIIVAVRPK